MSRVKLNIDKIGPHRALELVFDTTPGTINVIHGGNAGGKTKALEVLEKMGGNGSLEVTDGFQRGQATLADDRDSFTLKIGKRMTSDGTLPVWIPANEGRALATLVRPKPEKPEAREKARIQALCQLAGLEPTQERIDILAGGCDVGTIRSGDDLVTTAKQVKKAIEALALEQERRRDLRAGSVDAINAQLLELEGVAEHEPAGTIEELLDARNEAIRVLDRTEASHEERLRQESTLRATRRDLKPATWDQVRSWTSQFLERLGEVDPMAMDSDIVEELQEAAALIRSEIRVVEDHAEMYLAIQKTLNTSITGATESGVQAAKDLAAKADAALEHAKEYGRYMQLKNQMEAAIKKQIEAETEATHYRDLAGGVFGRLSEILGDAGLEDFCIDNGTLCVIIDGKATPYGEDRCSFGQLSFYALKVAMASIDRAAKGEVLFPVPWDFFFALDPEHRQAFADQLLCVGAAIVTEDPSKGGPVRVEQWRGGE